jgi:hypothetical protein
VLPGWAALGVTIPATPDIAGERIILFLYCIAHSDVVPTLVRHLEFGFPSIPQTFAYVCSLQSSPYPKKIPSREVPMHRN